LSGIFTRPGQNGTPPRQNTPKFRDELTGIGIAPSVYGFYKEFSMTKGRSMVMPTIWILALAIFGGCQEDRVNNIPAGATLSTSGNAQMTYTAIADGTVWVYDVNNDRIDYSGPLMANQSLVVNPDTKQITVDARVVSDKAMNAGAQHRIYFLATTH
jgi:hypothetical protein